MNAPQQWFICDTCNGSGVEAFRVTVYEPGCGFPHDDSDERPCRGCEGAGGRLDDVTPDRVPGTSRLWDGDGETREQLEARYAKFWREYFALVATGWRPSDSTDADLRFDVERESQEGWTYR